MRRPRGYLLMEMMLASAIIAVALLAAADHIASARRMVTLAAHKQTAVTLANEKSEEIMSGLPDAAPADQALTDIASLGYPGFKLGWTTVDASSTVAAQSTPTIRFAAREITVEVEFPTDKGGVDDRSYAPEQDGRAKLTVKRLWFRNPLPR